MNLMQELMEGSKRQKPIPYDQFMIERQKIEQEFAKSFRSSSGINIDRITHDIEASDNVSRNVLARFEKIPVKFGKVFGSFTCEGVGLTTLENSPYFVGKYFNVSNNQLTSLRHGPKYVGGKYDAQDMGITTLDGIPEEIHDDLDVTGNPIKTLKWFPKVATKGYIALPFDPKLPFGVLRLPMLKLNKVYFGSVNDDDKGRVTMLRTFIDKHLNKGRKGSLELQRDLIHNGFEDWSKFE